MARNQQKNAFDRTTVQITTPRVSTKFPAFLKPDYGSDQYPDPDGSYKSKLILDRSIPSHAKLIDKLDDLVEKARVEAEEKFAELPVAKRKALEAKGGIQADPAYATVYDPDTEEDTGKVEMNVKMKASGTRKKDGSKWVARPDVFDGKGKPWPKSVDIWGGSEVIAVFDAQLYFVEGTGKYGVSRRLKAIQVVDHVGPGGARSASSYGFEAQEDGIDAADLVDDENDTAGGSTSGSNGGSEDGSSDSYDF